MKTFAFVEEVEAWVPTAEVADTRHIQQAGRKAHLRLVADIQRERTSSKPERKVLVKRTLAL